MVSVILFNFLVRKVLHLGYQFPIEEYGFALHKDAFIGMGSVYGTLHSNYGSCLVASYGCCLVAFLLSLFVVMALLLIMQLIVHLIFTLHHNELRDFTVIVAALSEDCHGVAVEENMQPLSRETF